MGTEGIGALLQKHRTDGGAAEGRQAGPAKCRGTLRLLSHLGLVSIRASAAMGWMPSASSEGLMSLRHPAVCLSVWSARATVPHHSFTNLY